MSCSGRYLLCCAGALACVSSCFALDVFKADNAILLTNAASWAGDVLPGSADVAVWDAGVTGANAVDIGGPLTLDGLRVGAPGGAVTINGTARLTLDGGAESDIDLAAATQNLTVNAPATLSDAQTSAVGADRTLTFNGPVLIGPSGSLLRNGAGKVAFNGLTSNTVASVYAEGTTGFSGTNRVTGVTSLQGGNVSIAGIYTTSSDVEVYNGTLLLGGPAGALTVGGRIFAGRILAPVTSSDGLIIVSNGTHAVTGGNTDSSSSFIGVSGAQRGRLHVEGGSLTLSYLRLATNNKAPVDPQTDEIRVDGGKIAVTNVSTIAFMMGTRHDNGNAEASRDGRLEINGGRFEIPNGTMWVSTDAGSTHLQTQTVVLAGGVLSVKKITVGSKANATKNFWFNGGILQATNVTAGADLIDGSTVNATFAVQSRGLLFDSGAYDVALSRNLSQDPASAGGGLFKLGSGTLTLSGANTYTGPTVVSNGMLKLTGTLAVTNLYLAGGAFSMADGAITSFAPDALRVGVPPNVGGFEFEVAADGSDCDRLILPPAAWINQGQIALYVLGTRTPVSRLGDYPLMSYTGQPPSVAGLRWANPASGLTCAFAVDTATKTVIAQVRYDTGTSFSMWTAPGGGDWGADGNWNVAPVSAPGQRVFFGELAVSPAAVTLDAPFTLGELTFNNGNAFTLSGAGSLTLDNAGALPVIAVSTGSHAVGLPLNPSADLIIRADANATLTLDGAVGGGAGLIKQGNGTLALNAANTYAGTTTITGGVLSIEAASALSPAPVMLSGGRLRTAGAGPVVLPNTLVLAISGGTLETAAPTELTGTLDWAAGQNVFNKEGTAELLFKGSAYESGNNNTRLFIRGGTMRFAGGSSLVIAHNHRESISMSATTTLPRTLAVDAGATVQVGGLYTGSGPSNTVVVNGGSLTLTGSGANGESGLIRVVEDQSGSDRLIVTAGSLSFADDDWLSLGVRGGGAEVIVNGGTATFGRLSLGVRGDTTFASTGGYTYSLVAVNGGLMDVAGAFNWMGDINLARTNLVFLNGGTLRLPATFRSVALSVTNRSECTLNGGTLVLTGLGNYPGTSFDNALSGLNALYVGAGGAVIDTLGNAVTITQAFERADGTIGGLTKRGAGILTLAGPCAYVGATTVEEGTLKVLSTLASTGLAMSSGTTLSLRNNALDTLALSTAGLAGGARLELDVSTTDAACDQVRLPTDASVGPLVIALYNVGTDTTVTWADSFPIFSYSGTPPDVTGWKLAPECFGVACTFVVNQLAQTIDAQISHVDTQSTWANSGAGDWSVAANWWPLPPGAGAVARFGNALAADATVTADSPVAVAGLIFDHTFSYALAGSAITLDSGANTAAVTVAKGAHAVNAPLTLSGPTVATIAPVASLRVTGFASGAGSLTVEGGGLLSIDGTNTTPTLVRGGATVAVPTAASLGGAALTLDGGGLTVGFSDTLSTAVTLDAAGGTFRAAPGQTLLLGATVTGTGGLTKAGAGTVTLGASAGGYTGLTTSDGGTLSMAQLPAGGLVLGRGTLAFTGVSASSSQAVTLASGTNAAVLRANGDLTLSGPVGAVSGSLLKAGPGNVALTGVGLNVLGLFDSANQTAVATIGADGDGPAAGFGALNVTQGRLTLGADGQTNLINGRLLVGLNTTTAAGAETAGEVVIAGGMTVCTNWVGIGRSNGTTVTAPGGLSSRLLVQGGLFIADSISMGGAAGFAGYTGRPVLEIQGGTCLFLNSVFVNEAARGVSTVWVNGGTLQQAGTQQLRLGVTLGEGVLRVSSGTADIAKEVLLGAGGAGATGTVELAGGMLSANNIIKSNTAGYARVTFNGGIFRPRVASSLSGMNVAQIGTGAAVFDTSLAASYSVAQPLTSAGGSDGGVTKLGTNVLYLAAAMAYTGPTIVANGTLKLTGTLPSSTALTVAPGARFALNNAGTKTVTLSGMTLGDVSDPNPAQLELGFASTGTSNDTFTVSSAVDIRRVALYLNQSSTQENLVPDGTYTIITYTGAAPDINAFSVANGRYGKSYTFSASDGLLRLTIGSASTGANIWSATGGGAWSVTGNWLSAPGTGGAGTQVRFDSAIAASATVTLSEDVTLGAMHFNNTNAYTLAGATPIQADNGASPALLSVEKGKHTVTPPLALTNGLLVKAISGTSLTLAGQVSGSGGLTKDNSGTLALTATNTYAGGTTLAMGEIALSGGATLGSGPVRLIESTATLSVGGTTPSVLTNEVRLQQSTAQFSGSGNLKLTGPLTWQVPSTVVKQGAGELVLAGSGTNGADAATLMNVQEGTVRFAAGSDYRLGTLVRDVVKMDVNNDRARTLAVDAGAKTSISGIYLAYGTNSVVVDGTLNLIGNYDGICLRVNTGSQTVEDRFTVRPGGAVSMPQGTWCNVGVRGPGTLSVQGGSAQLGRVCLGYQNGGQTFGGIYGRVFVSGGGLLNATGCWNWMGDMNNGSRLNMLWVGDGTAAGGTVRLPATYGTHTLGWSSLILDGGTFKAAGAGLNTPTPDNYLAGLKQFYVGPAGATFNTDGNDATVTQPLCSDGRGGTLTKQGTGALTLAAATRWCGDIDVQVGALATEVRPAMRQTSPLPSDLLGRYSFEAGPAQDTSGNGRHGLIYGGAIPMNTGANGLYALHMTGSTCVRVPYDAAMSNVTNFTIATWLWIDNYYATHTSSTFFNTRLSNGSLAYETNLRVAQDGTHKLRFMATGNSTGWTTYNSTADIPLSNWVHVAVVVNRQGVAMYMNGTQIRNANEPANTIRLSPARAAGQPGFCFGAYTLAETSGMFLGRLDDMQVYTRALSAAEVQALSATESARPNLRVAAGAGFGAQGASEVERLSGEGAVSGALTVRGRVSPGDSTNALAGAILMAEALTLGTNTVYDWTWSPEIHDELRVGALTIDGACVLDCGRTEADPVSGAFRAVLIRYDTITGAANLANWTLKNVGRTGFKAEIKAVDNAVVLDFVAVRGTVLRLR